MTRRRSNECSRPPPAAPSRGVQCDRDRVLAELPIDAHRAGALVCEPVIAKPDPHRVNRPAARLRSHRSAQLTWRRLDSQHPPRREARLPARRPWSRPAPRSCRDGECSRFHRRSRQHNATPDRSRQRRVSIEPEAARAPHVPCPRRPRARSRRPRAPKHQHSAPHAHRTATTQTLAAAARAQAPALGTARSSHRHHADARAVGRTQSTSARHRTHSALPPAQRSRA